LLRAGILGLGVRRTAQKISLVNLQLLTITNAKVN
jgi:hypothetical protein